MFMYLIEKIKLYFSNLRLGKALVWIIATLLYANSGLLAQDICYTCWDYLKLAPVGKAEHEAKLDEQILLLELGQPISYTQLVENYTVLRRLDSQHFIVKKNKKSFSEVGSLYKSNHLWKLDKEVVGWLQAESGSYRELAIKAKSALDLSGIDNEKVLSSNKNHFYYTLRISVEELQTLLNSQLQIEYVGTAPPKATTESLLQDNDLTVNQINYIHHAQASLNGSSQVISIKENKFNEEDLDLRGRVAPAYNPAPVFEAHATQMATYIAGAANTSPQSRGVVNAAAVSTTDFNADNYFPNSFSEYFNPFGIRLQNHSYGVGAGGDANIYDPTAQAYDQQASEHPEIIHVFSVGNPRATAPTEGKYKDLAGVALLTGSFKQAKNIITVGSVDSVLRVDLGNASGPAYDGRVKPDFVAYSVGGSSNSAALVSGVTAQLQQKYKQKTGSYPNIALIKSVLAASAQDVGRAGPDFDSGWGNIQAKAAQAILDNNQFQQKTISLNQSQTINLSVPANAKNLRIALAWVDEPADINSNVALVQDIDLKVSGGGQDYLPWILDSSASIEALEKPAVRGEDHLNVIEVVSIEDPTSTAYTISISGTDLPFGNQECYVSWYYQVENEFTWTYPTGSDNAPLYGERPPFLRWESSYPQNTTGILEMKKTDGSWLTLKSNVPLSQSFQYWMPPEEAMLSQLRMTVNGKTYTTDQFTVARQQRPELGFACADSILIQWEKLASASAYNLYTLGDKYLKLVKQTTDTLSLLKDTQLTAGYFAIAPVINGKEAARSLLYNTENMGVGCFDAGFYAQLSTDDPRQGRLILNLGTIYGVDRVVFERRTDNGTYSEELSVNEVTSSQLDVSGISLNNGPNLFRAVIYLKNGQSVVTNDDVIISIGTRGILVAPNFISQQEGISLLVRPFTESGEVYLYDAQGKIFYGQQLRTETFEYTLYPDYMKTGIYYLVVWLDGNRYTEKIVVLE